MNRAQGIQQWTSDKSAEIYGINNWSNGHFMISERGEAMVKLRFKDDVKWVSIYDIACGIQQRGLSLPFLLRFPDILTSSIKSLHSSFKAAIAEYGYHGSYRGVYPIKVNQQQQVIEEIAHYGSKFHHGFEAGSKAELIIALAFTKDSDSAIICNGYKDSEYIDLALYGTKIGLKTFIVVERPAELELILNRARELQVEPAIGIRMKLSSTAGGTWAESAGDHSIFGLTPSQTMELIEQLKNSNSIQHLKLLHYHLGSQIPDIKSIRTAVNEASRFYVELKKNGAAMGYIDLGGGLAVDYDGSKTNFGASRNYSLQEYCSDVIEVIMSQLDKEDIEHPDIITESGRATVAYSSVLLFNILDINTLGYRENIKTIVAEDSHELIRNLYEVFNSVSVKNLQEVYHDAVYYRDEVRSLFLTGEIGLKDRGTADKLFWKIISKISKSTEKLKYVPEELQGIEKLLADIYYANFSIFQSLPDSWAIKQLFPIMPIHRLKEKPTSPAIIADITCDCDGKIDQFIDLYDIKNHLMLHKPKANEDYILGVFLIGAYQETLGDLHNLFGDTNIVCISLDSDGDIIFEKEVAGDSVADVLTYMEYKPHRLIEKLRSTAEKAVKQQKITPQEIKIILNAYKEGMQGYTYFEE
ncbi:MAG: biosynthetic arginine decarboxylase [Spirochaetales bacterium]|nr:biosynthetic arginine decarboxylase [Spirochaetales bacterium]